MLETDQKKKCLNCAHVFTGAYCPACGQKHGPPMPMASELVGDFLRSAFSPAGKIFESIWALLFKPGELSRVYFAGQHLRYVHPVRLYLLGVFLFVAAATLNNTWRDHNGQPSLEVATSDLFDQRDKSLNDVTPSVTNSTAQKNGAEIGRTMKQALPEWMRGWIKRRAERSKDISAEQLREKALRALASHYSLLFALLVPIMAAINWLLYLRRDVSYAGHVVFMLHGTAVTGLLSIPPYLLNLPSIYFPIVILIAAWYVLAARRAFGVSLWGALWRYLALMIPTTMLSTIAGLVTAVFVVVFA
jgi:hypothetical protein